LLRSYDDQVSTTEACDGTLLYWQSEGAGTPVLLIAGQASSLRSWDRLAADWAQEHRVIRYDHRGVGGSGTGPAARYSTRSFAVDAASILDAAGVPTATVIGYSMGGRIAQWLAIDAPDRVGRLVLISSSGGDARGYPRSPEATAALISRDRDRMRQLFFSPEFSATNPELMDNFFRSDSSPEVRRLHYLASGAHDAWDELARIDVPTLIVHGDADKIAPVGNAEKLAQSIPGGELFIEPRGRHGLHLESVHARSATTAFLDA
jgi:pimeloyl-ACP methyl ester carboxylesterase